MNAATEVGSFKKSRTRDLKNSKEVCLLHDYVTGWWRRLVTGLTRMDEQKILVGSSQQYPQFISINFHEWAYH